MTPDEFRRLGHALVDWIAGYRERLPSLPVMSGVEPGEIRRRLEPSAPIEGESLDGIAGDLERLIVPGVTHWNHPRFFAYFPANTALPSVLADLISSGLGVQGMSWQTSPAATELEETVLDWLRQMLGLAPAFTGVVQDTASVSTLVAVLCARERSTDFGAAAGAPLVVYASDQAHSSVEKAALLAVGRGGFRAVDSDGAYAMRPDALEAAIAADLAAGRRPCAVVATTGTTATTGLDPVRAVAAVARRHGLWLHVDAALAGSAMILPECRWMWDGVEEADSLVLNPHKWLGVGFDFSAYFVRDAQHLIRTMSTDPSYLRTEHDGRVTNFRDWGLPLGRRFRALKLWLVARDQGVSGLQSRLRRDLANAAWLREQVDEAPGWQRLAPVPLQTVCLRHLPPGVDDEAVLRRHNLAIAARINRSGRAYLTTAMLKGKQAIRVSIGALETERADVEAVWQELREAALGA